MSTIASDDASVMEHVDDPPDVTVADNKDCEEKNEDSEQSVLNQNVARARRGISQFFVDALTMDPTSEAFFERSIRKYGDKIEKKEREIKRQDETISKIREQVNELKRCTSEKRAASMKSMNHNLQLKLTPTIRKKNELRDQYQKLKEALEKTKEREIDLTSDIEQVKLRGRRVRAKFHVSIDKLENEIEKWKVPIIRMNIYNQIVENSSLDVSKIFSKPEDGVCKTVRTEDLKRSLFTRQQSLNLLQIYNEYTSFNLEKKEQQIQDLGNAKDAIDDFEFYSDKITDYFMNIISTLDPLLIAAEDFEPSYLSVLSSQIEENQSNSIENIELTFHVSQALRKAWKVLFLWLKSKLISLLNDFKGDDFLFSKKDIFFDQFFERYCSETSMSTISDRESDSLSFGFSSKSSNPTELKTREEKQEEVDVLKKSLEEQKKDVASLRKTLSIRREKSRETMLAKINQMNEVRSHMKNSISRLSSLEREISTLTLANQEHEGRIKILKIMKAKESTDGFVCKSILWSLAEEKKT